MAIFWILALSVLLPLFFVFFLISIGSPNFYSNLAVIAGLVWACGFALYHTLKVEEK